MTNKTTLTFLMQKSKFNEKEKGDFLDALNAQLKVDNHDISLDEKLDIITTCFDKNVQSVITQVPDLEELYGFKKCVRKYARVKMRAVTYYHHELHKEEAD